MRGLVPAEVAVLNAQEAVEDLGKHLLLLQAAELLAQAKQKIAEYVDQMMLRRKETK